MATGVWFRRDLRIEDNGAVAAAMSAAERSGGSTFGLFVFDPSLLSQPMSVHRLGYLRGALESLDRRMGGALNTVFGEPAVVLPEWCERHGITELYISGDFSGVSRRRDAHVATALSAIGVALHVVDQPTIAPPGSVTKPDGTPYQVFTPYFKAWRAKMLPVSDAVVPTRSNWQFGSKVPLPSTLAGVLPDEQAGEAGARLKWERYRSTGLSSYAEVRNHPGVDGTSRLSVDLHFGTIHPRQIVRELSESDRSFLSEICWREFYADVLFHRPDSVVAPLNPKFEAMTFRQGSDAESDFDRWTAGMTGYPIVDAGMRQLEESGWMHNRVRMITASFLVKDLHLDWRWGMRHFSAHLADADTASNTHGWQWVAGCGTDASPYYRVFNPTLQGQRFDPDGSYVRRWVPELANLPAELIHTPWEMSVDLFEGDLRYPDRIVDHDVERQIALEAYERLKNA